MPLKEAASFSIPFLSVLDENGKLDKKLEPKLSSEQLLRLYRAMVLARVADDRMLKLQRQGRMGTFSPATGQEAASCGATLAIDEKDWFVPAFRELGGMLMRGVPYSRILTYWGGFEEGNVYPGLERTLPIAVIVGSQVPHAVGIAYSLRYRDEKAAALCFFGDGATSQGDFYEGLNMAAVWQVPAVFVCQNNQWAISTPLRKQTITQTIAQKAIAAGIPGVQVDGNDALAVYHATKEAIDRARSGGGPTLIECVTYRLLMHTTADDPTKYRSEDEVKQWEKKDPLPRFRSYLTAKGLWNDEAEQKLLEEAAREVDAGVKAYETALAAPKKPDITFDHVFGTRHQLIEEQRHEYLAHLDRAGGSGKEA
jgi:pyruvate dehydrogenase E1 component alpha subunit